MTRFPEQRHVIGRPTQPTQDGTVYNRMWASGATPWRGNPRPPVAGAGPRPGAVHFSYVFVSHAFGFLRFWIPPQAHAAYPRAHVVPRSPCPCRPFSHGGFLVDSEPYFTP